MTMAIVFTSSNPVFLENIFLPQVSLRIDWTPKNPFLNMNRNWENSFFLHRTVWIDFSKIWKKSLIPDKKTGQTNKTLRRFRIQTYRPPMSNEKNSRDCGYGFSKKLFQELFQGHFLGFWFVSSFLYIDIRPKGRGRRPLCRPSTRCRPQGLIALS